MSEMTRAVIFIVALCFVSKSFGKTFSKCELVQELRRQGFPHDQLRDWLCLVEAESSRRSHVVGRANSDGSQDYGLFQINDRYWCSHDHPGKGCNVRCNDLLHDDISVAAQCTKKIFAVHGFHGWVGWVNKCKGRDLPHLPC